jgi:ATP-dependent Clp protease adaptor protein ClpS
MPGSHRVHYCLNEDGLDDWPETRIIIIMVNPEIEKTEEEEVETSEGPLYQVTIHNDDVTPMDFVLHILVSIFKLAGPRAIQVMYTAHYHDSAYVDTLPKPEAKKRIGLAHTSARLNGYPLKFSMRPESRR